MEGGIVLEVPMIHLLGRFFSKQQIGHLVITETSRDLKINAVCVIIPCSSFVYYLIWSVLRLSINSRLWYSKELRITKRPASTYIQRDKGRHNLPLMEVISVYHSGSKLQSFDLDYSIHSQHNMTQSRDSSDLFSCR